MKKLLFFLVFLSPLFAGAQEYRLRYDPSTIPELYNTTNIVLERKSASGYTQVKRGFRLSTDEAELKGSKLSYSPNELAAHGGILHFKAVIDGQEVPLSLELPMLKELRFNLYTDSIKPILNYYVNVEGVFSNGKVYPLTTDQVEITSDRGKMNGNEWVAARPIDYEAVSFTATSRHNSAVTTSVEVFIKKGKDPRDDPDYRGRTEEELMQPTTRRR